MFKIGPVEAYGIAVALVIITIIVAKRLQRGQSKLLTIPRTTGGPVRQNEYGAMISRNECPACKSTDADWYNGPITQRYAVIYCADPDCRAGFRVENYGDGRAYATRDEDGPPHLYGVTKR